jgi:hypothetical protein
MKVDSCEKIDELPVYLKELKDKSGALLNDDQKCLLDSLLKRPCELLHNLFMVSYIGLSYRNIATTWIYQRFGNQNIFKMQRLMNCQYT